MNGQHPSSANAANQRKTPATLGAGSLGLDPSIGARHVEPSRHKRKMLANRSSRAVCGIGRASARLKAHGGLHTS